MTERFDDLPAMRQLGDELREAGLRERTSSPPRRRSVPRWVLGAGIAALLAGGAATAATLLSTGDPESEPVGKAARYRPDSAVPTIVVTANDSAHRRWGVAVYRARSGLDCAVAGQVEGSRLGVVRSGRFHPYAAQVSGPCADLGRHPTVYDARYFAEQDRTLVYGRVRLPARTALLTVGGEHHLAKVGHGGAFLFLFEGRIRLTGVALTSR